MKRLFFPDFAGGRAALGLAALRIVVGLAFMLHGWDKIQDPLGWMGPKSGYPGWLQALAALSEFGGGLAWIVGLLTPLASIGILCTMFVAVRVHLQMGAVFIGPDKSYELPLVYLVVALLLLLAGPGKLSLDALFFNKARGRY